MEINGHKKIITNGFKLTNAPYKTDNTPIYNVPMEDGVMGKANNNGTIILNKRLRSFTMSGCNQS